MSNDAICVAVTIVASNAATNENKTRIAKPTSFTNTDFFVSSWPGRNIRIRKTIPCASQHQHKPGRRSNDIP